MRLHRWQPTRCLRPWDSPGKNTGVGCHFLLQCVRGKSESEVAQLCPTLRDPMDCSLPGCVVQSMGSQRIRHDSVTEQQQQNCAHNQCKCYWWDFFPLFVLYKSLWSPTCIVHLEHVLIQVHIVTCGQWVLHRHSGSRFSQLSTPSWKLHWASHRRVWSPVGQHLCIASRIQQRWIGWIHIGLHSPPQKAGAERLTPALR